METNLHKQLKEHGRQLLIQKGFQEPEINTEYEVKIGKMTYFVDVAGVSKTRSIAIECGETPDLKIAHLKAFFDEVILLPYTTLVQPYANTIRKNDEIEELRKKITMLKQQIETKNKSIPESSILTVTSEPLLNMSKQYYERMIIVSSKMMKNHALKAFLMYYNFMESVSKLDKKDQLTELCLFLAYGLDLDTCLSARLIYTQEKEIIFVLSLDKSKFEEQRNTILEKFNKDTHHNHLEKYMITRKQLLEKFEPLKPLIEQACNM